MAIATWWMSAFLLSAVDAATYLYFVQSIETRFFPPKNECPTMKWFTGGWRRRVTTCRCP